MSITLFTIGHGTRGMPELLALLAAAQVRELVDVRASPGSRRNPQFNEAPLRAALADAGVGYHPAGRRLGGRRRVGGGNPDLALPPALRGFAEYMRTPPFAAALERLRHLAASATTAIMCAERDPQQCHRALIADALVSGGDRVVHLLDAGARAEHHRHPALRTTPQGLVYDRHQVGQLDLGPPPG